MGGRLSVDTDERVLSARPYMDPVVELSSDQSATVRLEGEYVATFSYFRVHK